MRSGSPVSARRHAPVWGVAAVAILSSACASIPRTALRPPSLAELDVDPRACLSVELRDEVEVRARTIEEWSALPGQTFLILQYEELPPGSTGEAEASRPYLSLFLVVSVSVDEVLRTLLNERYLVTDIWRFYPERGCKVCHQWIIREESSGETGIRAAFQVLIEGLDGEVLEDRSIPIEADVLPELRAYYERMREAIRRKLGVGFGDSASI